MIYCDDLRCYSLASTCKLHNITSPTYVVGVDVGGTNTDCVCMRLVGACKEVVASAKTPTTSDVSTGIVTGIRCVLEMVASHQVQPADIFSVTIGTTHYVNAAVQRRGLQKVAVLRLCGGTGTSFPPLCDWPTGLKSRVEGPVFYLPGGYEVSGKPLELFDAEKVRAAVRQTQRAGVNSFAVTCVFSGSDNNAQEQECGKIIQDEWKKLDPHRAVYVTLASQVLSPMGFLERENAAILNASLCVLANKTVLAFKKALCSLGLSGIANRFFMSQNDGTVVSAELCRKLPILTFASGPTNTMRGAAFLTGLTDAVVIDLGGTTLDAGMLVNGFPRPKLKESTLAGVRVSYPIPDTISVGLGGGTIIVDDKTTGTVIVGPESVGHLLADQALCFGGNILTMTDLMVYLNNDKTSCAYGLVPPIQLNGRVPNAQLLEGKISPELVKEVVLQVRTMIERAVDQTKTSPEPIPLLVCGGGSILLYALGTPEQKITLTPYRGSQSVSEVHGVFVAGTSCVLIPTHFGVVNAVGAAISQISGTVSEIVAIPKLLSLGVAEDLLRANHAAREAVIDRLRGLALARAVSAGANRQACTVTEFVEEALTYVDGMSRFFIKVIGEWDHTTVGTTTEVEEGAEEVAADADDNKIAEEMDAECCLGLSPPEVDLDSYTPSFNAAGGWVLSETDLSFIADGAGVLGCGGGGSAYLGLLRGQLALRAGKQMTVVDPRRLSDDSNIACVAFMGAPAVVLELLTNGEEVPAALRAARLTNKCTHVVSLEVGGFNSIEPMLAGADLNLPIVDADGMGRAFPTLLQVAWFANDAKVMGDCGMADHRGEASGQTIERADTDGTMDMQMKMLGYTVKHGMMAGCCFPGLTSRTIQEGPVHSLSLAWTLGRAMALARLHKHDPVAALQQAGGGQVLLVGKVTRKEKITEGGYDLGRLWITGESVTLRVEFRNEYLVAFDELRCVASCPDLITIVDASSARAMQTEEIVYGLRVAVLLFPAPPALTAPHVLPLTTPSFFGFKDIEYRPCGSAHATTSVFDTYGRAAADSSS